MSHGNGSKEHLDADKEVLVASRDCASLGLSGAIVRVEPGDEASLLQDGQQEALGGKGLELTWQSREHSVLNKFHFFQNTCKSFPPFIIKN